MFVVVVVVSVPKLTSKVHAILGKKVACAAVSPHLYRLSDIQVLFYPLLR